MEEQELFNSGGNGKWCTYLEDSLQFLIKLRIFLSYYPASSYLPKGTENLCPHTNLIKLSIVKYLIWQRVKKNEQKRKHSNAEIILPT
jgi:hypothetical protein